MLTSQAEREIGEFSTPRAAPYSTPMNLWSNATPSYQQHYASMTPSIGIGSFSPSSNSILSGFSPGYLQSPSQMSPSPYNNPSSPSFLYSSQQSPRNYSITSPAYSPTSPSYSPTSPQYSRSSPVYKPSCSFSTTNEEKMFIKEILFRKSIWFHVIVVSYFSSIQVNKDHFLFLQRRFSSLI